MEKALKKLLANNVPPKFKFKDTYESIEVPVEYQQFLPTQAELETEFDEMIAIEEALPTVTAAVDNLEVISANLYVNTTTGGVGIGTSTPGYALDVAGDARITSNLYIGTANLVVDTMTGNVGIGTSTPGYALDVSGTANVGALTATTGTFSGAVSMSGKTLNAVSGLNWNSGTSTLSINGGITQTRYRPGEIIETLQGRANGRSISVLSGTYTLQNVTGIQEATTAHVVINGSSISYKPPPGTTRVTYEFWCFFRQLDAFPIMHCAGRVAGTQVSDSRHTWRGATGGGSDYQTWVYSNMTLTIGEVASDSLANGQLASWTTNKTLDFTFREYSASYEGRLHITNHWDGGGTDILVRPFVKITAIA